MLEVPGFSLAGEFRLGQFHLQPEWRKRGGVYAWAHPGEPRDVIRVGIACGASGIGGRFTLHNKWLRGEFKPNDAREKAVRYYTLEGLGDGTEVWCAEVPDRSNAAELERLVRLLYGPRLKVDLATKGSWIKAQMDKWRLSGRPMLKVG